MFTQKHYKVIADTLYEIRRELPTQHFYVVLRKFVELLELDNEKFNVSMFLHHMYKREESQKSSSSN